MKKPSLGLTSIRTEDLKKLLWALHHGHLTFPLSIETLTCVGLQHCATTLLAVLRGLEETGVRAVAVTVLAERMAVEEQQQDAVQVAHGGEA